MPLYLDYGTWSGFGWVLWTIFSLALMVRLIVCMWKVFKKAGRKWRESLIPIWNIWVMFWIAWVQKDFRLLFAPFIVMLLALILPDFAYVIVIIWRILSLCAFIVCVALQFKVAKKFWKSGWFWLWLLFLCPIFYGILAFDDSKYSA